MKEVDCRICRNCDLKMVVAGFMEMTRQRQQADAQLLALPITSQ